MTHPDCLHHHSHLLPMHFEREGIRCLGDRQQMDRGDYDLAQWDDHTAEGATANHAGCAAADVASDHSIGHVSGQVGAVRQEWRLFDHSHFEVPQSNASGHQNTHGTCCVLFYALRFHQNNTISRGVTGSSHPLVDVSNLGTVNSPVKLRRAA